MSKGFKYALIFTSGAIVGVGACVKAVCHFVDKETLCDKVIPSLKKKVTDSVYYLFYASTPEERCRREYITDDIEFSSLEEATTVIEKIKELAGRKGFITEKDLYTIVGVEKSQARSVCGWTSEMLGFAHVYSENGTIKLVLPKMVNFSYARYAMNERGN